MGAWDAGLLAEVPQVGPQVVEVEVRFFKAGAGADQPPTLISLQVCKSASLQVCKSASLQVVVVVCKSASLCRLASSGSEASF